MPVSATVIAIPGRHEASRLADCCPACHAETIPVAVVDDAANAGRVAAYRCTAGHDWLCWWSRAELEP
jgi:hypothetical protein